MENTQTFNTKGGITKVLTDLSNFLRYYQINPPTAISKHKAIHYYQKMYNDSLLFPPCNVTNSLQNDILQYKVNNIKADVKVISHDQDKLLY